MRVVERDPAAGHDVVDVRMVGEGLPPGVQDSEESELRSEVLRVASDRRESFRRGRKEQVIDRTLIAECDRPKLTGKRKDDVEVGNGEHLIEAILEPAATLGGLTPRAVAVSTGVVGDALVLAGVAAPDMAAEISSTAITNAREDDSLACL